MGEVREFKLREKKPAQVYECSCGCQLWFIEDLPPGKSDGGKIIEGVTVFRCFGCSEYVVSGDLLSNAEDDE